MNVYRFFRAHNYIIMRKSNFHLTKKVPFNWGKIQNLMILIQDQVLRDVEQHLERIASWCSSWKSNSLCHFSQDVSLLASLLHKTMPISIH